MAEMNQMFSLSGRRALVTGAARGIGRAIALTLAQAGARVACHDRAHDDELAAVTREAGADAMACAADLEHPAAIDTLVHDLNAAFGGIDILVLCASIEIREAWDKVSDDAFASQVAVNLDSTRRLVSALVPGMAERGWGRVLAIGSVQEIKEHPQMLIYAALKSAQTSMMRNLARQLGTSGVTCNTLAPGAIATARNAHVLADPAYARTVASKIPLGQVGEPQDLSGAALFLCSDAARYVTGIRLLVDGGMHL